jgi:hypothetical protein
LSILCFPIDIFHIFSVRERCSLVPCSGFEVFVPGRQEMASAMYLVCKSAYLIRRTVSHLLCRL